MGNTFKPIKHGTSQGYRQHWYRGDMPACAACQKAWRVYYAKKRNTIPRLLWLQLSPEEKQEVLNMRAEVKDAKRRIRERNFREKLGVEGVEQLQAQESLAVSPGVKEEDSREGDQG